MSVAGDPVAVRFGDGTRLLFDGDLALSADGVEARITGHGGRVVVQTTRPAALVRRALSARAALVGGPGTGGIRVRPVLTALRRHGVTVELRTPSRVVARVGAGTPSPAAVTVGAGTLALLVVAARRLLRRR